MPPPYFKRPPGGMLRSQGTPSAPLGGYGSSGGGMPRDEARTLRDRIAEQDRSWARQARDNPPASNARIALTVIDGGSMPTAPDHYFLGKPTDFDGAEAEGGTWTGVASDAAVPFIAIRGVPKAGDIAVATAVGGRWVAEVKKTHRCRWLCGPYAGIDPPSYYGLAGCSAALATVAVADDGSISALTLIDPGSCYDVAHPEVGIGGVGGGSGATATATVGAVVSLTLSDRGKGYDPANPPEVKIDAPAAGGTRATATATVDPADGSISALTLADGGALYAVANPGVTIQAQPAGGTQATATAAARPGVVTSLTLDSPGSGYRDNTPPGVLYLTVACDAWTATIPMPLGGAGGGGGSAAAIAPGGTLPYCAWGGSTTVDIPGTIHCPGLPGTTIYGSVYDSVDQGYVAAVTIGLASDLSHSFACHPDGALCEPGGVVAYCLEKSSSPSLATPWYNNPPPWIIPLPSCSSRPCAFTTQQYASVYGESSCQFGPSMGWVMIARTDCPASVIEPGAPSSALYTFTVSES